MRTRSVLFRLAAALVFFEACVIVDNGDSDQVDENGDPRVGELGRVSFVGGGGCNSSTAMALGSTAELTIEPVEEGSELPAGLVVGSSEPKVIEATAGIERDEVVLTAHEQGSAHVELTAGGLIYDSLEFSSERAFDVDYTAHEAVFAGGAFCLKVNEVYGACGQDCPLIGGGFIDWQSEPSGSLVLTSDGPDRVACFDSGGPGHIRLIGEEPTLGTVLIDHGLSAVAPEATGELEAMITVQLPDESVLDPRPMPVELPVGSLFLIEVQATSEGGVVVVLAGSDVVWTVDGDPGVVARWSEEGGDLPEGPIFETTGAGAATLVADVALIGKTGRFEMTVTPQGHDSSRPR